MLVVLGRKQHCGDEHFIAVKPDGTLTLLPAWMADSTAASFRLIFDPRLSVKRLSDLGALVDALLASSLEGIVPTARRRQ